MANALKKEDIAELARRFLSQHQTGEFDIAIVEEGIREEDDCWYIPVLTDKAPKKTYAYYDILAETEMDLEESENVNILFVPTRSAA